MSPAFAMLLGVAALVGGLGIAFWGTHATRSNWSDSAYVGSDPEEDLCLAHWFLGRKGFRWHYDLMLVLMNAVIACTDGGKYVLCK
jgi:hypothetical protein